jgi:RNA polymerase sigma factor (sigma-70 family)
VSPDESLRWVEFAKRVINKRHPEWHLSDDDDGLVWLAVNDCLRTYDPDGGTSFRTWLGGRVCFRMIDQRRAARDWARPGRWRVDPAPIPDIAVCDTDPFEVADLLDRLPVKQRAAIVGTVLEGRTLREVGVEFGVSESMVCVWRKAGLATLRQEVAA